jgi:hypothetical protein
MNPAMGCTLEELAEQIEARLKAEGAPGHFALFCVTERKEMVVVSNVEMKVMWRELNKYQGLCEGRYHFEEGRC